jgi:hypothetical protein
VDKAEIDKEARESIAFRRRFALVLAREEEILDELRYKNSPEGKRVAKRLRRRGFINFLLFFFAVLLIGLILQMIRETPT